MPEIDFISIIIGVLIAAIPTAILAGIGIGKYLEKKKNQENEFDKRLSKLEGKFTNDFLEEIKKQPEEIWKVIDALRGDKQDG